MSEDEKERNVSHKRRNAIREDNMELDEVESDDDRNRKPRRKHAVESELGASSDDDRKPPRQRSKRHANDTDGDKKGIYDDDVWERCTRLVPSPSGGGLRLKDQGTTMHMILQESFDIATASTLLVDAWPDAQDIEWNRQVFITSADIVQHNAEAKGVKYESAKARLTYLKTVEEVGVIVARFEAQNGFVRAAFKMVSSSLHDDEFSRTCLGINPLYSKPHEHQEIDGQIRPEALPAQATHKRRDCGASCRSPSG